MDSGNVLLKNLFKQSQKNKRGKSGIKPLKTQRKEMFNKKLKEIKYAATHNLDGQPIFVQTQNVDEIILARSLPLEE